MINDVDFKELESEKYWSFPKSYKKDARLETKNMIFSKYGESVFVISSICLLTPLSIAIFLSCKKSMFEIIQIVFENFFVFIQKQEK